MPSLLSLASVGQISLFYALNLHLQTFESTHIIPYHQVECEDGHVLCPGETAADTALYIQYTRGEFKRSRSYPKVGAELAAAASKNVRMERGEEGFRV